MDENKNKDPAYDLYLMSLCKHFILSPSSMHYWAALLSKNKEDPFPIAGINIPAKVVSGDFYNFSDLGDGKYGFGVADVSGKGIKSSLLMSKASSLYRCLSKTMKLVQMA